MWRSISHHRKKADTEFFDAAMHRLEHDEALRARAEATLAAWQHEPVFRELFFCPQSPTHHAEGPTVWDHLRLALVALYGILEDKWHLPDIEEFRRLKGYDGEIEELEETIKEHAATMETYLLCHDLGKPRAIWFEARAGSQGESLGFNQPRRRAWEKGVSENLIEKYQVLYEDFFKNLSDESPASLQSQFFLHYQISIHYPGHASLIHEPDFRAAFDRVAQAHRLSERESHLLFHGMRKHMDVIEGFRELNVITYAHLVDYAEKLKVDVDDFLDQLLAFVFLDAVCGSRRGSAHGAWHDVSVVVYFLKAEREYAPWRQEQRAEEKEARKKKEDRQKYREVGLDGDSILALLGAKPSPEFGKLLAAVQAAAKSEGALPELPREVEEEVERRILLFRQLDKAVDYW